MQTVLVDTVSESYRCKWKRLRVYWVTLCTISQRLL